MLNNDFDKSIDAYINYKKNQLDALKNIPAPVFSIKKINCDLINEKYFEKFYKSLKLDSKQSTIYYFKIPESYNQQKIIDSLNKYKNEHQGKNQGNDPLYLALPQVNNINPNNILYIGKSISGTKYRLKGHFGLASNSYYGMHLLAWKSKINIKPKLQLEFYFGQIPTKDNLTVELIESSLHHSLKPILGREGS